MPYICTNESTALNAEWMNLNGWERKREGEDNISATTTDSCGAANFILIHSNKWMGIWKHIENYYIYLCVVAPVQRLSNSTFMGKIWWAINAHIFTRLLRTFQQLLTHTHTNTVSTQSHHQQEHELRSVLYFRAYIGDKNENAWWWIAVYTWLEMYIYCYKVGERMRERERWHTFSRI